MIEIPSANLLESVGELQGKVVLITGGAGGFGKATAVLAAENGAKVIIADLKPSLIERAIKEVKKTGGICSAPDFPTDVTKADTIRAAFDLSLKEYGKVPDVVIANAGVALDDHFEEYGEIAATENTPAHPRSPRNITLAVNLSGVLNTGKIAQEYWQNHPVQSGEGKKRRLVIVSSIGGMSCLPGASLYSSSKHAVLAYWQGICRTLQAEGEKAGYECFAVCPFFAKTRIFQPETLFILSGIPLVPVPLIVKTLLYTASCVSDLKSPGKVIILPDFGDPAIASHTEYDALSDGWSRKMNARCEKTNEWFDTPSIVRFWRDVAWNFYGVSSINLLVRLCLLLVVAIVGCWLAVYGMRQIPTWGNILLGMSLGLAGKFRGGRDRKKKSQA